MAKITTPPCPTCGTWTVVKDSRLLSPTERRRVYECANGHRFVTMAVETVVLIVNDKPKPRGLGEVRPGKMFP